MKKSNVKVKYFGAILVLGILLITSFQNCAPQFKVNGQIDQSSIEDSTGAKTSNIEIAWDPVTDAKLRGYKIYYGTSMTSLTSFVDVGLLMPQAGAVNYIVKNLPEGATYHFAVVAYDASGVESPKSNLISKSL